MSKTYKQFVLNYYPTGLADEHTWKANTVLIPKLQEGEVLLKITHWSVDPYMRPRMNPKNVQKFEIDKPVPAGAVGVVVESKNENIKVGENYFGELSLSEYHCVPQNKTAYLKKCDPKIPASYYLSVFGLTGITAYQGVVKILDVKKGDKFFVNAAEGAVGSVAGTIAKLKGAFVVGCAGGEEKCKLLTEKYGFDASIDYKKFNNPKKFGKELARLFPKGIDKYFDNVGGFQTDCVFDLLNVHARVAVCGQISQYAKRKPDYHKFTLAQTIYSNIRIEGFYAGHFMEDKEALETFQKEMTQWISEEKIPVLETVFDGFDTIPIAFKRLFQGQKKGKVVIKSKL